MIKKRLKVYFNNLTKKITESISFNLKENGVEQLNLMCNYRRLIQSNNYPPLKFSDVGFRNYSQHDEDGIILFIFSLVGVKNRKCVEICAGNGIENNTTNLLINHRWTGLLFDGNPQNVETGNKFFKNHPNTKYWPPTFMCEWITKDNINELINSNGMEGEIDLLSLDIDGNDYWILDEIDIVSPRVIVLEINHLWGAREAVTVPYDPEFSAEFTQYGSDYAGASLTAFVKLCHKKGYYLVGVNNISTNAFFIRKDIIHDWLPEVDPNDCFTHPRAQFGITERFKGIKNKKWVKIE